MPEPIGNELGKIVAELEVQLLTLRKRFGTSLYLAQDINGTYIAPPILIALVQGYSALAHLQASHHKDE